MSSSTNLFTDESLATYLGTTRRSVERKINQLNDIVELDAKRGEIIQNAVERPIELRREGAQFSTHREEEGLQVVLTVPFEGDARLFCYAPKGYTGPRPSGTVEDGSWLRQDEGPHVKFARVWTEAPSSDEVRTWGREVTDSIEGALASQRFELDQYNATIQAQAADLIDRRRAVLEAAADLDRDLGCGV